VTKFRILLIDKDPSTTNFLKHELTKADFEVFSANQPKEGLILAYQHRPHVVILDPNVDLQKLEELILKFKKDHRLTRTKIIAFSSLTDPTEIQAAIDLGLHEYLPKEGNALPTLIEKTRENAILARQGTNPLGRTAPPAASTDQQGDEPEPAETTLGKTIVFLSSKGGVGTSSLCANIAHIISQKQNAKVVVVDLVLPIGSIANIVGNPETLNIVAASQMQPAEITPKLLKQKLTKLDNWDFRLIAGSSNPEESNNVEISNIPVFLDSLRKIADYIFIDIGKSLSRISMPIIKSADQIAITLSLDPTTVNQTKAVWDYLTGLGITKEQVYFLINRSVSLEGLAKSEVEEIMGLVIPLAVPYMGRDFSLANKLNQPIADKFPQDAVTISLRQAGDDIIRRIDEVTKITDYF
jgi:MinD-like ATPase involved in chromosome partitioning or flagellar assembly/DNA-binding NarL/FixJ family response regulator